jgi:hypothetical protein
MVEDRPCGAMWAVDYFASRVLEIPLRDISLAIFAKDWGARAIIHALAI